MQWLNNSVSASRVINADPQALFDIVADPTMHPVFDGSGSVKKVKGGHRKLAMGDRFTAGMRVGVPYRISNTVVEYDEGRRIAWAHVGGWRWRFEFEAVDGGTLVTETFDWSTSKAPWYVERIGWPRKNQANIDRTLARLDAYVNNTSTQL